MTTRLLYDIVHRLGSCYSYTGNPWVSIEWVEFNAPSDTTYCHFGIHENRTLFTTFDWDNFQNCWSNQFQRSITLPKAIS